MQYMIGLGQSLRYHVGGALGSLRDCSSVEDLWTVKLSQTSYRVQLSLQRKVTAASVAWANVQTVPASSRSSSTSSCLRNFTSQEVQTVQYERGFGGRPATTLKVTSGPGSLQRPVPPAKPQGFRKQSQASS